MELRNDVATAGKVTGNDLLLSTRQRSFIERIGNEARPTSTWPATTWYLQRGNAPPRKRIDRGHDRRQCELVESYAEPDIGLV